LKGDECVCKKENYVVDKLNDYHCDPCNWLVGDCSKCKQVATDPGNVPKRKTGWDDELSNLFDPTNKTLAKLKPEWVTCIGVQYDRFFYVKDGRTTIEKCDKLVGGCRYCKGDGSSCDGCSDGFSK